MQMRSEPDNQNSVISFVMSKWLLPEPLDSCRRPEGSWALGTRMVIAMLIQLKPYYAHAHGCTEAFLSPVIVAFSNFSGVV